MSKSKTVKRYKYKNIATALAILLLAVLGILSAFSSGSKNEKSIADKSLSSEQSSMPDSSSSNTDKYSVGKLTGSYQYKTLKNGENLGRGNLILVNSEHNFTGELEDIVSVYPYLFNKSGDQIMSTSSTNLYATKECFTNFNQLVSDFYKQTQLSTLMISDALYVDENNNTGTSDILDGAEGTNTGSVKTDNGCYEHNTGLAVDLHLYNAAESTYPVFDGKDKYSWISENCWKYGFILRYPADRSDLTGVNGLANHFRYVGAIHAQIMHEKDFILEDYLNFIKDYSFETPYSLRSQDGSGYAVYFVPSDDGTTTNVPVPLNENGSEYPCEISGNNIDGYIVSAKIIEGVDEDISSSVSSTIS